MPEGGPDALTPAEGSGDIDEAQDVPAPSSQADGGSVIDETDQPAAPEKAQPGFSAETVKHENDTRRWIAIGGMLLLAVLAIGGLYGWLNRDMTAEQIQSFAVIFSPVVAVLGPILGFYFSKAHK